MMSKSENNQTHFWVCLVMTCHNVLIFDEPFLPCAKHGTVMVRDNEIPIKKLVYQYLEKKYWELRRKIRRFLFDHPVYCVITKIPDSMNGEDGNLASATLINVKENMDLFDGIHLESELYLSITDYKEHKTITRPISDSELRFLTKTDKKHYATLVSPVFELGEILILNEPLGREIGGRQRAPRKWFIEFKEFRLRRNAIKCAQDVMNAEYERKYGKK